MSRRTSYLALFGWFDFTDFACPRCLVPFAIIVNGCEGDRRGGGRTYNVCGFRFRDLHDVVGVGPVKRSES